ncbi:titin isoform X1 [Gadus chalcogrammus]|uniref:titin isoform X1 n=1 Tax=Gadus chalcogrammus TaxID=1042646 RepID=UPI0024C4978B|nr:titin isoform X1 [Gadus chalcogrammus]XP_056439629.1 titin isoform X1 [Gadus chalcogrammus]XP_056439630.1 titin isoform X1 [Gadus chalcogrammus]XP_056439631.1 titin isoform X1 [Gadus chalcogrammus]
MDSKHLKSSGASRKLNFLPNKEISPKQRGRGVPLDALDGLLDNLDSSLDGFNIIIPMPITTSGAEEKEEAPSSGNIQPFSVGPKGEPQPPAGPVKNKEHNLVGLEASSLLVEHYPINTSSPLEAKHQRVMEASPDRFLWDHEGDPEDQPKTSRPSMARDHSSEPFQQPAASSEPPVWRPGTNLPSSSSGSRASFIQKLRATSLSRAPRESPVKEPEPSWEPEEEPEEEFLIGEDDPPAWITLLRKKNPSSYKQKCPDALPGRNDYGVGQPSSPNWALESETGQKDETRAPGRGGEPAGLEEGRAWNKKKEKKEKAAAPSQPSPKKSAWKRAKSKGTDSPTEMVEQEPSPLMDVVNNVEYCDKKKPGRKKVTKERVPAHNRPKVQPQNQSSPSQAVKLKTAPTWENKEQSSSSVLKKSKSTKGPQQEMEERKKKTKAGKAVKMRKREEMLLSESPARSTQEEQIQQESMNNEADHVSIEPPWEPEEEPDEEFPIREEDPPAWITLLRKKNPSSYKQKCPDARLEEGRARNKKEKKEKAAAPSQPSPKKSAWKRAKSKGTDSPTEMVEQEPSPLRDAPNNVEDCDKKKPGRKKVTKESMPSHNRPKVQPPHHSSPSQAVKLKTAPTWENKEQSSSSALKKSKSTKGPQQEMKERKKKTKAGKFVKRRKREEMLLSESPARSTQEEQIQQDSMNNEAEHVSIGLAIPKVGPLLTSEVSSHPPRKRPWERGLSLPSSPEEPGGLPALKKQAHKQNPRRPKPLLGSPEPAPDCGTGRCPRIRNCPGELWKVSDALPDGDILPPVPLPPPPGRPQSKQRGRPQSKQRKSLNPPTAPESTTTAESKPVKQGKMFSAPKTIRRSLATFHDIFSQSAVSPPDNTREEAEGGKRSRRKRSIGDSNIGPLDALNSSGPPLIIEAPAGPSCSTRLSWPPNIAPPQPTKRPSSSMLKGFQSGPSSFVDLEQHEEDELASPQWTRTQSSYWLSLGLYAAPLVPMVLQDQDAANLEEWLAMLWPAPAQELSSQAGSEAFEWFCHQGRVIGLRMDMWSESMCNGEIILSSSMKKPLWVDHCATTVFYVSTSHVLLTLNAVDFRYKGGQSFVVPCGQAYSLENSGDEPALLFFSRVQV